MTDVKAPEPDADVLAARKRRRRRWTWGGVISTAASIATIVSVLNATGGSSHPSGGTTFSYPAGLEASLLESCEADNPTDTCDCALTWLENNVSAARAQQDETSYEQTGESPTDFNDAVAGC